MYDINHDNGFYMEIIGVAEMLDTRIVRAGALFCFCISRII